MATTQVIERSEVEAPQNDLRKEMFQEISLIVEQYGNKVQQDIDDHVRSVCDVNKSFHNKFLKYGFDVKNLKHLAFILRRDWKFDSVWDKQILLRFYNWCLDWHFNKSILAADGDFQSGIAAQGPTTVEGEVIEMQAPKGPVQSDKVASVRSTYSNKAPDASLSQVFHRPYKFPTVYQFSAVNSRFDILTDLAFPQVFNNLNKLPTFGWLTFHALTRMDFKVTIRIDTTNFHSGLLLMYAVPGNPTNQDNISATNFSTIFNYPHVFLKIGDENEASLIVPYGSLYPLLSIQSRATEQQSQLRVVVLSPLVSGAGQPTLASYSVWVEPIDAQVSVKSTFVTSQSGIFENLKGIVETGLDAASKVGTKPWSPLVHSGLDSVFNAIGLGADSFWNKLAKGVGGIVGLFDRVNMNDENSECARCSDEPLRAVNLKPNMLEMVLDSNDRFNVPQEYDLVQRCRRMSLAQIMGWSNSASANSLLGEFVVSPTSPILMSPFISGTNNIYWPTNLFSVASLYRYWRGDLIITMEVISTRFHKGQLLLAFDPYGTSATTADEIAALPCLTYTLGQADNRMTFRMPYTKHQDYCDVSIPTTGVVNQLGRLYVLIQTPLSGPSTVSNQIEVLFYISAGDNLEFKYLVPYDTYPILREIDGTFQSAVEVSATARDLRAVDDVYNDLSVSQGFMMGSHTDARILLRRPEYIFESVVMGSAPTLVMGPLSYLPASGLHRFVCSLWKYNSGSVNIHVVTNASKVDRMLLRVAYDSKLTTDFTSWTGQGTVFSPTLNQMWQGVVHTLNSHGAVNINVPAYREVPFRFNSNPPATTEARLANIPGVMLALDGVDSLLATNVAAKAVLAHSCADEFALYLPIQMPRIAIPLRAEEQGALVPPMTGPTVGDWTIFGTTPIAGAIWQVADRLLNTTVIFNAASGFSTIIFQSVIAVQVARIFISTSTVGVNVPPGIIRLEYSNDGTTFFPIDEWSTVDGYLGYSDVSTPVPAFFYRFSIASNPPGGTGGLVLREIQLYPQVFHNPSLVTLTQELGVFQSGLVEWSIDQWNSLKDMIASWIVKCTIGGVVDELTKRCKRILKYFAYLLDIVNSGYLLMVHLKNNFAEGLTAAFINFIRSVAVLGFSAGGFQSFDLSLLRQILSASSLLLMCQSVCGSLRIKPTKLFAIISYRCAKVEDLWQKLAVVLQTLFTWFLSGDSLSDEIVHELLQDVISRQHGIKRIVDGQFSNCTYTDSGLSSTKNCSAEEFLDNTEKLFDNMIVNQPYFVRTAVLSSAINCARADIGKARKTLISSVGPEPVVVTVVGDSGIGKGEIFGKYLPVILNNHMRNHAKYKHVQFNNEGDYEQFNGKLVHILTTDSNKKFDSRYANQNFIHFDDAFTESGSSMDAMLVKSLVNTSRVEVLKADVADKGSVYCSPFVIISTNARDIPNVCKTVINDPNKLLRRLGLHLELIPKESNFKCNFSFLNNVTSNSEFYTEFCAYVDMNYTMKVINMPGFGTNRFRSTVKFDEVVKYMVETYDHHLNFTPSTLAKYAAGTFQNGVSCDECFAPCAKVFECVHCNMSHKFCVRCLNYHECVFENHAEDYLESVSEYNVAQSYMDIKNYRFRYYDWKDKEEYKDMVERFYRETGQYVHEDDVNIGKGIAQRYFGGLVSFFKEYGRTIALGGLLAMGCVSICAIVKNLIQYVTNHIVSISGLYSSAVYECKATKPSSQYIVATHGIPHSLNQSDVEIMNVVRNNNLPIRIVIGDKVKSQQHCLFINDHQILVNKHFLENYVELVYSNAVIQIGEYDRYGKFLSWRPISVSEEVLETRLHNVDWYNVKGEFPTDVQQLTLTARWPNVRNIGKFFVHPSKLRKGEAMFLMDRVEDLPTKFYYGDEVHKTSPQVAMNFESYFYRVECESVTARPVIGDCGRVYYVPRKGIVGIHSFDIAYSPSSFGFAPVFEYKDVVVTPQISQEVKAIPATDGYWSSGPLYSQVECEGIQYSCFTPTKSQLTRLYYKDQVLIKDSECSYSPSCKKIIDVNGEKVNPLFLNSQKYQVNAQQAYPKRYLDLIVDHIYSKFKFNNPKLLSNFEVINGVDESDGIVSHLNLKSSSGVWSKWFHNGKQQFFEVVKDDGMSPKVHAWSNKAKNFVIPGLNKTFLQHVRDCEDSLKSGQIPFMPYLSTLKDELRPDIKVKAGKTRVFEQSSLDLVVLWRKYFGQFSSDYKKGAGFSLYHGIGKDKESVWKRYAEGLLHCNNVGFAFDYKNFDGTVPAEAFYVFEHLVHKYYAEENIVRVGLISQMKNAPHILNNYIYESTQGNKSGNVLTDVFNSIANTTIMMCAFMSWQIANYEVPNLREFDKNIRMLTYGDDIVMTVKNSVLIKGFDAHYIRKIAIQLGLNITSAIKDNDLEKSSDFSQLTFLKSPFIFDKANNLWLSPLPIEDILKELKYQPVSTVDNLVDLEQRIFNVLRFLAHHSQEVFDYWVEKLRARGIPYEFLVFNRISYLTEIRVKQERELLVI